MHNEEILKIITIPDAKIIINEWVKGRYVMIGEQKIKTEVPFRRLKIESRPSEDSLIYYELWLPDEWNGVFVGTGNGGMAGGINYLTMSRFIFQNVKCGQGKSRLQLRLVTHRETLKYMLLLKI